jgi:hypothetical protein
LLKKEMLLKWTFNGLFTLAKFVSKTVNNSNTRQSCKSHVTVTTVLTLATLGGTTTNRNDPIYVTLPKVAKASIRVSLSCVVVASVIVLTFVNVNKSLRLIYVLAKVTLS